MYQAAASCYDSQVADWGNLYNKLKAVYIESGLKFFLDSDFCSRNLEFLINSL